MNQADQSSGWLRILDPPAGAPSSAKRLHRFSRFRLIVSLIHKFVSLAPLVRLQPRLRQLLADLIISLRLHIWLGNQMGANECTNTNVEAMQTLKGLLLLQTTRLLLLVDSPSHRAHLLARSFASSCLAFKVVARCFASFGSFTWSVTVAISRGSSWRRRRVAAGVPLRRHYAAAPLDLVHST